MVLCDFFKSTNFATYCLLKVSDINGLKESRVDDYGSEYVAAAKSC